MKPPSVAAWADGAINMKAPVGEASRSWWADRQTREQFDVQVREQRARFGRSRFGRLAVPTGTRGFADGG